MSEMNGWDDINVDVLTAYQVSKILWPEFVLHANKFVILADMYSLEYFEEMFKRYGTAWVEGTMNTYYLQYLFDPVDVDDATWEALGKTLCEMWVAKARMDFPGRDFVAEFQWYSDDSDPGIMIEQTIWRDVRLREGRG